MIPHRLGRIAGTGGGGKPVSGFSVVPVFCSKCGARLAGRGNMECIDVCKRCRVGRMKRRK